MSLDKQRILSQLGSVMNQLKSADCGCMEKLFSNQNQGACMSNSMSSHGGCRRGCCHSYGYNYSSPCAGEPHPMNHSMHRPCVSQCNPPKLYADTYNYLSNNLMQPVMKEVYDDLKSISPANTVMNSPLANQMGLTQGNAGATMQGNIPGNNMGMQNAMAMESSNANLMAREQPRAPVNAMGGMGPQILNMIMGDGSKKPNNTQGMQGGQLTSPTVIDAPQSPHGQIGLTPITHPSSSNAGKFSGNMNNTFNQHGNMNASYGQNPTTQYMTQQPTFSTAYEHGNSMISNITGPQGTPQIGNVNNGSSQMGPINPNTQQMSPINNRYGQHAQGVTKFNEMFPGVMQGGDLGFDPMAIAIQMNPANQQKAAMDTMQKLMTGSPVSRVTDPSVMKPVMDATKTAVQNIHQPNTISMDQNQQNTTSQFSNQQNISGGQQNNVDQHMISAQHQAKNIEHVPQQQQQIYNAGNTSALTPKQQEMQVYQNSNPMQQYQQPQMQYITDPNTGAVLTPPSMPAGYSEINANLETQQKQAEPAMPNPITTPTPQMVKEPIFPADTSRNRPYTHPKPSTLAKQMNYNTLGQPIEMLPARLFHPPEESLPQTLSPQSANKLRNDYMRYSNVKSTVSKTSLMGNKPIGRTPSRSQLQHLYNQYKGSQSFTQQNVQPPVQGGTFSEGKLNVPSTNVNSPQVPVEKFGGDTIANNLMASNPLPDKGNPTPMGHNAIGDVPMYSKPQEAAPIKPLSPIPTRQAKLRNGLQDVVYTSYPSSAAWSFHGTNTYRPATSVGYRFRNIR